MVKQVYITLSKVGEIDVLLLYFFLEDIKPLIQIISNRLDRGSDQGGIHLYTVELNLSDRRSLGSHLIQDTSHLYVHVLYSRR